MFEVLAWKNLLLCWFFQNSRNYRCREGFRGSVLNFEQFITPAPATLNILVTCTGMGSTVTNLCWPLRWYYFLRIELDILVFSETKAPTEHWSSGHYRIVWVDICLQYQWSRGCLYTQVIQLWVIQSCGTSTYWLNVNKSLTSCVLFSKFGIRHGQHKRLISSFKGEFCLASERNFCHFFLLSK